MATVYLALGSNIGDAHGYIKQTVALLTTMLDAFKSAPLYRSKAVGYIDQPDFVNTVVSGTTDLPPEDLLARLKTMEKQIGRTPTFRNGPREIDIDVILYGDMRLATDMLTIPHPAFRERDFVLRPLANLNSTLIDPISGKTVQQLLSALTPSQKSILKRVD